MTHFENKEDQKESPVQSGKTKHHHKRSHKNSWMPKFLVGAAIVQVLLLAFIAFQIAELNTVDNVNGNVVAEDSQGGTAFEATVEIDNDDSGNDEEINADTLAILIDDDAIKGDPDAPITIVEFSDYECPFCTRFYDDTLGLIEENYIDTGKVKFVYRDFPLSFHPNAQKAAEAAECAGEQDRYYEMHDLIFENGATVGVTGFKQFAEEIGLDTEEFNECLDSGAMSSEVRDDFAVGSQLGVSGTPAFFINGILVSGAQPFSVFEQIIEGELQ